MKGSPSDPGIIHRAIHELFRLRDERSQIEQHHFCLSVMEIYNERITDLLTQERKKESTPSRRESLRVRSSLDGRGVFVDGLKNIEVSTAQQALCSFETASERRAVGATKVNSQSSRSHLVVTVTAKCTSKLNGRCRESNLTLVDLAGSERLSVTRATGNRLEEAKYINKSLAAFGNVLKSLRCHAKHVPYRDSKLTHFLSGSLGGKAKVLVIVTVDQSGQDRESTISSLNFASQIGKIQLGRARINDDTPKSSRKHCRAESVPVKLAPPNITKNSACSKPQRRSNSLASIAVRSQVSSGSRGQHGRSSSVLNLQKSRRNFKEPSQDSRALHSRRSKDR